MLQQRIDELKGRLELLRREVGEVEYLITGYENTQKEQKSNGVAKEESSKPKPDKVNA